MNGPAGQFMFGMFEIVMAILGIALFALLLNRRSNTVAVVDAAGSQLSSALSLVTLQSGTTGALYR